ncbi:MraY family glycosyltransferase [Pigmentiphaga sp.]|uniref:MraY family glycosyltransferase n=1 Tax=Pigmentiphaga sp. TaxID=1977564 RepID=UPI00128B26BA|nr:MraY family glycosyltransferase [Pigmentiphaga sp.]MPS27832.1 undecaprenyl/decaprenyl-phosphate alpha-N-acetylglucosaminyl 1-phosphate transferase [Alcaligenaceae bacterium SAGV5]MPS50989.1 undecaprenyl/decaprenyl-phosphate alpha-N-acetylglucosaminyl 1-phosphate transferase [Alcaligenaceae bacterium SAGV3]MPT55806.1 undecaprenyl/decaprenyl-phosphate alpha-N-acetylglucosaminyl 1-phosphate transferase [Alcaligenaceae bacterium]
MIDFSIWQKGLAAGILTTVAIASLIPVARKFQLLDFPAGRKDHSLPTPVVGGLAMIIGIIGCYLFFGLRPEAPLSQFLAFAVAGGLLIVVGQLDDKFDLPWWFRIVVQIIATLITSTWGGVRAEHLGPLLGLNDVSLGIWSIPFTVFATVGLINALNMIDGVDGFAGSLCLVALIMLAAAASYSGNAALTSDIAPICGALFAFLIFNFRFPWRNRAKIFMGNGGSAFLGFTVAWVSFRLTQTPDHPVTPALALWLIPVPLIDCLVLMLHRVRRGFSPFKADHNHIHHLMRDAGASPMQTVVLLALFSVFTGLIAAQALRHDFSAVTLLATFVVCCGLWWWVTAKRERALRLLRTVLSPFHKRMRENSPAQGKSPPVRQQP